MKTNEIALPGNVEPEALQMKTRTLPPLAAGELCVHVEAAGVSYAEVQMRFGRYPGQPAFPFVPGYDIVGRVVAVGPGVSPDLVGRRIASLTGFGGWSTHVVVRAADAFPAPEAADPAELVALVVNGLTAYRMLHDTARARAGQTVVVLGAGGGVGSLLVQLARLAGVHVIGTCNARQKGALEALGISAIDYRNDDVSAEVRRLAPEGVAAVFDHVGGESLRASWRMLGAGGTLVSYGSASSKGDTGSPWWPILRHTLRLAFWNLRPGRHTKMFDLWGRSDLDENHVLRPARFRAGLGRTLEALFALHASGQLEAKVARRFPLREAGAAIRAHEAGGFVGKMVLVPDAMDQPEGASFA